MQIYARRYILSSLLSAVSKIISQQTVVVPAGFLGGGGIKIQEKFFVIDISE